MIGGSEFECEVDVVSEVLLVVVSSCNAGVVVPEFVSRGKSGTGGFCAIWCCICSMWCIFLCSICCSMRYWLCICIFLWCICCILCRWRRCISWWYCFDGDIFARWRRCISVERLLAEGGGGGNVFELEVEVEVEVEGQSESVKRGVTGDGSGKAEEE